MLFRSDLQGAWLLARFGLSGEALRYLRSLPAYALETDELVEATRLLKSQGARWQAKAMARRASERSLAILHDTQLGDLAFPQRFDAMVFASAKRFDIPAALIFAVIREESGFRPKAKSARRARGLMQMLPETGKRMAKRAGVREIGRAHV